MTEDDAKTKACCGPRNNSETAENSDVLCIASACMAWRRSNDTLVPTRVHPNVLDKAWAGWTITDPAPDARGYVEISPPLREATGFCGLAGAPHP